MIHYFFGILIGCLLWAHAQAGVREDVLAHVPPELAKLSPTVSAATLHKQFDKKVISKNDKDAIYLHYFGKENDVTIGLKNNHYDYLFLKANSLLQSKTQGLFQKLYVNFNSSQKKEFDKAQRSPSHDAGRTLTMNLPQEGLTLLFHNDEEKSLYAIVVRPRP